MKRRDELGAPARCCCAVNGATIDEHTDFAHTRIRERIKESVRMLKRVLEDNVRWEKSVGWLLSRGTLVLVALVAMIVLSTHAPRTQAGLVEYKYITGVSDGNVHVLMLNVDGKVVASAAESENDMGFSGKGLVVDGIMENEIMERYNDLEYRASIRSPKTDRSKIFTVSRDIFNTLEIGSTVKFEIDMPRGDKIRKLITEDTNIIANDSYYPEVQTVRQYRPQ